MTNICHIYRIYQCSKIQQNILTDVNWKDYNSFLDVFPSTKRRESHLRIGSS